MDDEYEKGVTEKEGVDYELERVIVYVIVYVVVLVLVLALVDVDVVNAR